MGSSSDFYKFEEGDNKLHILTEPKIEVSRYGYGVCYEGAPFCTDEALEKSYQEAMEKAKAGGLDPNDVQRPQLRKAWLCWAINRKNGKLVILTLTWGIAKKLTEIKRSEEQGFETWPMPYGINVTATDNGKTFNGKKVLDYAIISSRKDTPITEEETAQLAKKTPVETILEKKKEKSRAASSAVVTEAPAPKPFNAAEGEVNPDDIPF